MNNNSINEKDLHPLLASWKLKQEDYEDVITRYSGFGRLMYPKLATELPFVFNKLVFYQPVAIQTEDSLALYDDGIFSFAIQLNSDSIIGLWNEQTSIELGHWVEDLYGEAINIIMDWLDIPPLAAAGRS